MSLKLESSKWKNKIKTPNPNPLLLFLLSSLTFFSRHVQKNFIWYRLRWKRKMVVSRPLKIALRFLTENKLLRSSTGCMEGDLSVLLP